MLAMLRIVFALFSCALLLAISHHEVSADNAARSYGVPDLEPKTGTRDAEPTTGGNANARRPLSVDDDVDDKRVFGGLPVNPPFKYPFLVNLVRFNLLEYCGGSLISPTVVMTAAHCNKNGGEYIWIGRHDLSDPDEWDKESQSFQVVDRAFSNPRYIGSANYHDNDIMLLLLDRPVDTEKWPPILLDDGPITAEVESEGIRVTVMGWGATEFSGGFGVEIPREVTVTGIPRDLCNSPVMYDNRISRNMICAADFGQDACQGDSGGPLIADPAEQAYRPEVATDEPVLVGVVSWGIGCAGLKVDLQEGEDISAQSGYPGIYTRVANYKGWVTEQLAKWESEPARFLSDRQPKVVVEPSTIPSGGPEAPCGGKRSFVDKDGNGLCVTSKDASGKCMNKGGYTMSEAQETCDALGARLCTLDELKANEARGSGCGLDKALMYTATPCPNGGLMIGSGGNGGGAYCSAPEQPQVDGIRCCL